MPTALHRVSHRSIEASESKLSSEVPLLGLRSRLRDVSFGSGNEPKRGESASRSSCEPVRAADTRGAAAVGEEVGELLGEVSGVEAGVESGEIEYSLSFEGEAQSNQCAVW
eukprot:SAG11_NODE_2593_length_3187_cov_2.489637_1_plen_111_part_00